MHYYFQGSHMTYIAAVRYAAVRYAEREVCEGEST